MQAFPFFRVLTATLVVSCAGGPSIAHADDQPQVKPSASAQTLPAISAEALPLLEAQRAALLKARAISGKMTYSWLMRMEGQKAADADTRTQTQEFIIAHPGRVMIKNDEVRVFADGKTLTIHNHRLKQYIQKPQPAPAALEDEITEISNGSIGGVPCEEIIRPDMSVQEAHRRFKAIDRVRPDTVDAKPGKWVGGLVRDERMGPEAKTLAMMFFADGDPIARTVKIDYTDNYKDMDMPSMDDEDETPAKVAQAEWTVRYADFKLDPPLSEDAFTFKPGADDKKVDEFGADRASRPSQDTLLGLAAPAFEGQDLDGNTLRLSDLKGKVVVLDFWATWCGPCVAAMPKMQELKDKYAAQPVVFLGMNTDAPGSASKVKKFLEKKKITIRQFDASDGATSESYRVSGIPCVVMIDKTGLVQDIHVGFGPGEEETLASQIDTMLKDKPLHTEAEFKAKREAKPDDEDQDGPVASRGRSRMDLPKVNPERLAADGSLGRTLAGFHGGAFTKLVADISGRGDERLILQNRSGSLVFVKKDGSGVDRITLQGVGGQSEISRVHGVTIGGEMKWLVAWQGMGRGKQRIGLFDAQGAKLWDYTPELPSGANAMIDLSTGDLTGDGKVGIAVLVSAFKFSGSNGRDYQRGSMLALLDDAGKLLAQSQVADDASFVHICAPESGKGGAIILGEIGNVRRMRFDPSAKTIEAAVPEEAKTK